MKTNTLANLLAAAVIVIIGHYVFHTTAAENYIVWLVVMANPRTAALTGAKL